MGTLFNFTPHNDPVDVVADTTSTVKGMSWLFGWSDVEPSPGQYDFTAIELCLGAAHAAGKLSMLRVMAGEHAPAWALNMIPSVSFFLTPAGPVPSHQVNMCIPWDINFVDAWCKWITAYGKAYDGDPRIAVIQMPGCGHLGELPLGSWPGWFSSAAPPNGCGTDPYTFNKLLSAWERIIDAYVAAFPHTRLALDG